MTAGDKKEEWDGKTPYPQYIELRFGYVEEGSIHNILLQSHKGYKSKLELFDAFCRDIFEFLYLPITEDWYYPCGSNDKNAHKKCPIVNERYKDEFWVGVSPQKAKEHGAFCNVCGRNLQGFSADYDLQEIYDRVKSLLEDNPTNDSWAGLYENWETYVGATDIVKAFLYYQSLATEELNPDGCILEIYESASEYVTRYIWEKILEKDGYDDLIEEYSPTCFHVYNWDTVLGGQLKSNDKA